MKLEDYIKSIPQRADDMMEELTNRVAIQSIKSLSDSMKKAKSGREFSARTMQLKPVNAYGRFSRAHNNETSAMITGQLLLHTKYRLSHRNRSYTISYNNDLSYIDNMKKTGRPFFDFLVDNSKIQKQDIKRLTYNYFVNINYNKPILETTDELYSSLNLRDY